MEPFDIIIYLIILCFYLLFFLSASPSCASSLFCAVLSFAYFHHLCIYAKMRTNEYVKRSCKTQQKAKKAEKKTMPIKKLDKSLFYIWNERKLFWFVSINFKGETFSIWFQCHPFWYANNILWLANRLSIERWYYRHYMIRWLARTLMHVVVIFPPILVIRVHTCAIVLACLSFVFCLSFRLSNLSIQCDPFLCQNRALLVNENGNQLHRDRMA